MEILLRSEGVFRQQQRGKRNSSNDDRTSYLLKNESYKFCLRWLEKDTTSIASNLIFHHHSLHYWHIEIRSEAIPGDSIMQEAA